MRLLILFGAMLACAGVAEAQPLREVPVGRHIDWTSSAAGLQDYRSGPVRFGFRARAGQGLEDLLEPVLTVTLPGLPAMQAIGVATRAQSEHRAAVGNGPRGPFVFFQSFSGGAHCCTNMQLIERGDGAARVVNLGDWNGGYIDELPRDLDGDGALDLVLSDDRFLYAFSSYAGSMPPPRIMSVIDGRAVDVSHRPAFRSFFETAMAEARRECAGRDADDEANGPCAAYVASAARLGRFDEAWAVMLREYDQAANWPWPSQCRVATVDHQCPAGQEIEHDNFPDALRAHLIETGYIAR